MTLETVIRISWLLVEGQTKATATITYHEGDPHVRDPSHCQHALGNPICTLPQNERAADKDCCIESRGPSDFFAGLALGSSFAYLLQAGEMLA